MVIEGISYVKSFRTDFAAEIQQKGLDEVIARLEKENEAPRQRQRQRQQVNHGVQEAAALETTGDGRVRVVGSLGFSTVKALLPLGSDAIRARPSGRH